MYRRHTILAGMAAVIAVVVAAAPVMAGGWTPPEHVEDDPQSPIVGRPAIALHDGVIHVAVAGGGDDRGIRLHSIDGETSRIRQLTTRRDRQPTLAISDDGVFHLAFSRRGTGCGGPDCTLGIFYAKSPDGDQWTVERVHGGEHDVHPSLALDPAGKPWIYFRSANRIVEAHKSQGDWSNVPISSGCCGTDPLAGPEATVVGGQGQSAQSAGVDSISGFTRLAVYRETFDGGRIILSIFELDTIFSVPVAQADDAFDPDLVLDTAQDLHVVYRREGDGLWYAEPGRRRFERTKIASAEIQGMPAIAALPDGSVVIVAATSQQLIYRTNATGTWTGGSIPMTGPEPAWPALATTSSGAARAVFLRDEDAGGFWLTRHSSGW